MKQKSAKEDNRQKTLTSYGITSKKNETNIIKQQKLSLLPSNNNYNLIQPLRTITTLEIS